jgi:hypothetical protein
LAFDPGSYGLTIITSSNPRLRFIAVSFLKIPGPGGDPSSFNASPRDTVTSAYDVQLIALGVAHQSGRRFHKMNEGLHPAATIAVGAVDQSSQRAQIHEHPRHHSVAAAADDAALG